MAGSHRILQIAALALALAVALAGCMRVDRALVVSGDGSGTYTLTIGFREPAPNDPSSIAQDIVTTMEVFGAHVQQAGGSYRRYEDQGYEYWAFTRSFSSAAQANALLQDDPRQYDPNHSPVLYRDSLHIARENRLFTTRLHVTGEISLADPFGKAANWKDATETVVITMPDGIISYQGGARDGDTITYSIQYNQSAAIDVVGDTRATGGTIPSIAFVSGEVVLVLLAVILVVLGIRLLRRPAKQ
jgi:hypothetical protein